MKKEFVPYNIALAMKNLGFNQTCYAYYSTHHNVPTFHPYFPSGLDNESKWNDDVTIAPLFSQAFRWFRDNQDIKGWITPIVDINGFSDIYEVRIHEEEYSVLVLGNYDSYEEAELACLEKMIEVVEQKGE